MLNATLNSSKGIDMNISDNPDSEVGQPYDQLFATFNNTSIGMLYQLLPNLLSEEHQALLDEMLGNAKVEVINLLEHAQYTHALNQKIDQWRNQARGTRTTRVIVRIINQTTHTFNITQTTLPLSKAERESFQIPCEQQTAFKSEFNYNYAYPWPKNKIMFNQFVDFFDDTIGVRFDLGLIMNTSFGLLSPTLRPSVKNTVKSIGSSPIKCSTKTTLMGTDAPFHFEVEITLG
jgi:hypothetical protein